MSKCCGKEMKGGNDGWSQCMECGRAVISKELHGRMLDSCEEDGKWMVGKLLQRLKEHKLERPNFKPVKICEKFIDTDSQKKKKLMCYCEPGLWKTGIFGKMNAYQLAKKTGIKVTEDGEIISN